MKRAPVINLFLGGAILAIGLVLGIIIGIKRGIPFVTEREQWTIAIYRGDSPFDFPASANKRWPVLKAEDITDMVILAGKDEGSFYGKLVLKASIPRFGSRTSIYFLHETALQNIATVLDGNPYSDEYAQHIAAALNGLPVRVKEKPTREGKSHLEFNINDLYPGFLITPFGVEYRNRD